MDENLKRENNLKQKRNSHYKHGSHLCSPISVHWNNDNNKSDSNNVMVRDMDTSSSGLVRVDYNDGLFNDNVWKGKQQQQRRRSLERKRTSRNNHQNNNYQTDRNINGLITDAILVNKNQSQNQEVNKEENSLTILLPVRVKKPLIEAHQHQSKLNHTINIFFH